MRFSGCARGRFLTMPYRASFASASAPPPCSRKSRSLCSLRFSVSFWFYNNQLRGQKPRRLVSALNLPHTYGFCGKSEFLIITRKSKNRAFTFFPRFAAWLLQERVNLRHFIICVPLKMPQREKIPPFGFMPTAGCLLTHGKSQATARRDFRELLHFNKKQLVYAMVFGP